MSKHPLLLGLTLLSASLFTDQAFADRTVTDQLGRQVTLPDHITRVVVLQHQTLNLLVQLHAAEDIVGVLSSWQKQLGPQFARFMPEIGQLATPGDLTQVNIESLLALRPQVGFCRQLCAAGDDRADPTGRDPGGGHLAAPGRRRGKK
ncbi:ABC-type Fe3+-hydroxamate transport system substrate-binding protein [Klebsiella sp. SORGH_AS 826]|nr:ABC-type Fe3+-hydroxamate transport system substrate-binding protein [Klebsiella sp. SORGH_AS_0826]